MDVWAGTSGPRDARIMVVGEAWGRDEDEKKQPFVGQSGEELTRMLAEAGISRNECFLTNVVSARPYDNDMRNFMFPTAQARAHKLHPIKGLYPKAIMMEGLEILQEQISRVQPKAVIALGNYPTWALTDQAFSITNSKDPAGWKIPSGITSWRGSQLYVANTSIPLMPTYHPAAVMRQWQLRPQVIHDLRQRLPKALKNQWAPPNYNFIVQPSFDQVMSTLEMLYQMMEENNGIELASDLETVPDHIACHGLAWTEMDAICIPYISRSAGGSYWSPAEEAEIVVYERRLLKDRRCKVYGQNYLYDAQYQALYRGYLPSIYLDTMLIHRLCFPGTPGGLDYLSSLYCKYHSYWKDEGKSWHPSFSDVQQWTYNCKDCVATLESGRALGGIVRHFKLEEQFAFQMTQWHAALNMMMRGVRSATAAKKQLSIELGEARDKLAAWLEGIVPPDVLPRKPKAAHWFDSPQQTMTLLFDVLKLDKPGNRRSSDDEAIMDLMLQEPMLTPILQGVLDLRSVKKFKRDFVEMREESDGRIRCFFDPSGAKTFRWASKKSAFGNGANLQTIPKGTED